MLHTFQEVLVCTFAYIVLVAIAYKPQPAATFEPEAQPINYFPEVEDCLPELEAEVFSQYVQSFTEPEPLPAPAPKPVKPTLSSLLREEMQKIPPVLEEMGIRDLYRLASEAGIAGYKKMTKQELLIRLTA